MRLPLLLTYFTRGGSQSQAISEVTTPSGLKIEELKLGDGPAPQPGQTINVHYIGWLENGTEFNNSHKAGAPVDFKIGTGDVIKGWDEGLITMKVGGKRRLSIPSDWLMDREGGHRLSHPTAIWSSKLNFWESSNPLDSGLLLH